MFQVLLENLFSLEEGIATSRKRWVDSTDSVSMDVFNSFVKADPSPTKKYLDWMLEQHVNQKESLESISGKVASFDKAISRNLIQNKDIYKYETLKDLEKALQDIEGKKTKTEIRKEEKIEGAEKVFENDKVLVISPSTHKASCYYGKGTKWCTTETSSEYFDRYKKEGTKLYYILPKDGSGKTAVAVHEDDRDEIFDEKNNRVSPFNFFSSSGSPLKQYGIPRDVFAPAKINVEEIIEYTFEKKTWGQFLEDLEFAMPYGFFSKLKGYVLQEIGDSFYVASNFDREFPILIERYWLDFTHSEKATFSEEHASGGRTANYFGYVLGDGAVGFTVYPLGVGGDAIETSYLFVKDRKAFAKKLLKQEI